MSQIQSLNDVPTQMMDFPKNLNVNEWNNYMSKIGKQIGHQEIGLFNMVIKEKHVNDCVVRLFKNGSKHNLFIPVLTEFDGDCLFASLHALKVIDDIKEFRKDLAFLMYYFGDMEYFLPDQKETLREVFQMTNDIEYVYCKENKRFYKYDFDTMCKDLSNESSWSRLPTQIIMMVMSVLYKIQFIIISDGSEWINKVPHNDNEELTKVYLGHLGEVHYIPLVHCPDPSKLPNGTPLYNRAYCKFIDWARMIYFYVNYDTYKHLIEKTN
jgi:hypothetical protein